MSRSLAIKLAVLVALAAIAAWRGVLGPGVAGWLLMTAGWMALRDPHERAPLPVAASLSGRAEAVLLQLAGAGMLYLPLAMLATPLLDWAARPQPIWALLLAVPLAALGLWLLWRSHADLGRNRSPSLELREGHGLVTGGVYARMRHPMCAALFAITAAQTLLLPNWVAGPAGLIGFAILYMGRVGREEDRPRGGDDARTVRSRLGCLCRPHRPRNPTLSRAASEEAVRLVSARRLVTAGTLDRFSPPRDDGVTGVCA
jgi:protein-S-isoprenylcysteine O-methyltransferase Ste14